MYFDTDWLLTAQRVAVHLPTATAVLADLHLGYNATRRRRGEAVPLTSVAMVLAPLGDVLRCCQLTRIVIAGDLFEDGFDDRVVDELRGWLAGQRAELVAIIPGNHDRRLAVGLTDLPVYCDSFFLGRWRVVHGDHDLPDVPAVFGHFHPSVQFGPYTRPCYLVKKDRLMLPAFSRDARGVDVSKMARWRGWRRLVPVGDQILDFGEPRLKRASLTLRVGAPTNPKR
jgi:putative SbcD/Mre11-related phosphoesterase